MFNLKDTLGLSSDGYRDFKRGVAACVLTNLTLLPPFVVLLRIIAVILDPIISGNPIDTVKLWLLLGAGAACAVAYFIAYGNEYSKTYTVAYSEAVKIRLEIAELLRKLPLSFFNNKDLSELSAHMMEDCTQMEHTMSHVTPGLCANIISVALTCAALAVYDWRMALALFAAMPIALGMILLSRGLQSRFGERHVKAKLAVAEQVQEYLEGIKVVKAFGLSGEKSVSLTRALKDMRGEAMRFEGLVGVFVTLAMMILQVGVGLVTLIGVNLLTRGSIDTMKLLAFIVVSARIYAQLIVLLSLLPEFFYLLVSTRRMRELRNAAPMTGMKRRG